MNKTVLVTGASGSIGNAIASLFAKKGYNTVFHYNKNTIDTEMLKNFDSTIAVKADLTVKNDIQRMFEQIEETFGSVDILINNAGTSYIGLFSEMTDNEIDELIDIDLKATLLCSKAAIPNMVHKKDGCIVNVSSMWGEVGASCEAVYSAAKAGIIGFTKALAKELGPSNIRVNCVSPGFIFSKMNENIDKSAVEELKNETPLCRLGTPEDVANAVYFIATESASFITGQVLSVNGGLTV